MINFKNKTVFLFDNIYLVSFPCLVVLAFLTFSCTNFNNNSEIKAESYREVANKLKINGINNEAIKYYELYLKQPDITNKSRAEIGIVLAELLKNSMQLESALGYLYQIEIWAPSSEHSKLAGPMIVEILERLGKTQAASQALATRTTLSSDSSASNDKSKPDDNSKNNAQKSEPSKIIGKVNGKSLTIDDFEEAVSLLPEQLQKELLEPQNKKRFLNDFMIQELLLSKAKMRNLDKNVDFLKKVESFSRQVMVSEMLGELMKNSTRYTEDDLKHFYEVNKEKFKTEDGKYLDYAKIKDQIRETFTMSKVQEVSLEMLEKAKEEHQIEIYTDVFDNINNSGKVK